MKAWQAAPPGHLRLVELPTPRPGPDELLVRVRVCAVCRTDLHVVQRDLPTHRPHVVPGHEVVGEVAGWGDAVSGWRVGERVGVAWLRRTDGTCRYCARGAENLCPRSEYTGWDADGGYAEYTTVPAAYAYRLPAGYDDDHVAPLLCAGIIGYRALKRANLPPGGRLGIYGFGASAHLTAQLAIAQGATVHVFTRSAAAQRLALSLGAVSAADAPAAPLGSSGARGPAAPLGSSGARGPAAPLGSSGARGPAVAPEPLDAAILFAPAGELVPVALAALDRGGTLSVAGIHLSDIPVLNYDRHLFQERQLVSVTANTRADGHEFLALAARHPLHVTTTPYPFAQADQALRDLAADRVDGAAVLRIS